MTDESCLVEEEEEDELEPYIIRFLREFDMGWDEFINFDAMLATNEMVEDDWEKRLLEPVDETLPQSSNEENKEVRDCIYNYS